MWSCTAEKKRARGPDCQSTRTNFAIQNEFLFKFRKLPRVFRNITDGENEVVSLARIDAGGLTRVRDLQLTMSHTGPNRTLRTDIFVLA